MEKLFSSIRVDVNIHSKPQLIYFKQMFTTLWQRHSTKLVTGVSTFMDH